MLLSVNAVVAQIGFQSALCTTWNVTHEDAKLQSGRRDSNWAERRYRSSLLCSHIVTNSHVVSRATHRDMLMKSEQKVYIKWSTRDQPRILLMDRSNNGLLGLIISLSVLTSCVESCMIYEYVQQTKLFCDQEASYCEVKRRKQTSRVQAC